MGEALKKHYPYFTIKIWIVLIVSESFILFLSAKNHSHFYFITVYAIILNWKNYDKGEYL